VLGSVRLAARLFSRYALPVFVSTVMFLLLLGYARIYSITTDLRHANQALKRSQIQLKASQHEACLLRRAGRANTNLHDRVPLKAALQYLGDVVEASALKAPPGPNRSATLEFAHRFQAYAASVQPLTNPKC
jgi:hypothetical protein